MTVATSWRLADLPDQRGRTVLVTGATGGLGQQVALELARHGARVVLAGRSEAKLDATTAWLRDQVSGADLERLQVDVADLDSVRRAAASAERFGSLDCLVNNAGVMATPAARTVDGLDLQLATNHFGPFLLTGLLLPQLVASGDGRVVHVSSMFHHRARSAPLDDPRQEPRRYRRWQVYAQSKLANLLTTFELDRRATAGDLPIRALAAHPGYAATHLLSYGQTMRGSGGLSAILDAAMKLGAQPAAAGALPLLMAATADLPGTTYCGPGGPGELRGSPRVVRASRLARDPEAQRRLWELSEETVGLRFP